MASIDIADFRGRRPVVDDATLGDSEAVVATDCRIQGGKIRPLHLATTIQAKAVAGTLTSLHLYEPTGDWFEWDSDVDVVQAQVEDSFDRRIFTGDGAPKITDSTVGIGAAPMPTASYLLGVPPPGYTVTTDEDGDAPTLTLQGTADDEQDVPETRYYVVTSVDKYGAEGVPSPVSTSVDWRAGQSVDVGIPAIPAGNYSFTGYRIYRTSTGTSGTDFLYVAGGTSWGGTYNDTLLTENLSEVLPTEDFDLPNPNMIGITAMPNGYHAAHYKNILFFSEPGYPHAWPVKYQINTKEDIVGIEVLDDNTLLVTTKEKPYICSGSDPYSMVLDEVNLKQACTSKRSIVDMGYGVVYASPDGLVMVGGDGPQLITEGVWSREQWQALDPTTIDAYFWEGLYIAFYNDGSTQAGFIFNPAMPAGGVVDISAYATAGYNDLLTDTLYLAVGGNIVSWDTSASYYTFIWRGKKMDTLSPMNLGVGRLYGDSTQAFTVKLFGDGVLRDTLSETDGPPFRFSSGDTYRTHQIELRGAGYGSLHGVRLGETMRDMKSNGS